MGAAKNGTLVIQWPSKKKSETSIKVKADQWLTIEENKGIIEQKNLR
jgi:hypothetical protein